VVTGGGQAAVGLIAYGSSDPAVRESLAQLAAERGLEIDYLRVRAWPFAAAVRDFVAAHQRVYVVEQNRDAQLAGLLKQDLDPALVTRLVPLAAITGPPLDARTVTEAVAARETR
jgi:2-oxoglutarate ferredoxin oxidoreductase subunit alpha